MYTYTYVEGHKTDASEECSEINYCSQTLIDYWSPIGYLLNSTGHSG